MGSESLRVLIVGANYGLLLAVKLALASHRVTVVGRHGECDAINAGGACLEYPDGQTLSVTQNLASIAPSDVDPQSYDFAFLAIQEPQAAEAEMASLLLSIGNRLPIASVMNLPPETFLRRLEGFDPDLWQGVHAAAGIWSQIPCNHFTCASPDPQAYRPDPTALNRLRISHVANFKFAPFASPESQAMLTRLSRDVGSVRFGSGERAPIHIVRSNTIYTPLAKWPMLVTGNCRCVRDGLPPLSIQEAVNQDLEASRSLYEQVSDALVKRGVPTRDLVRFDDYAHASQTLVRPSSVAMALEGGVAKIERIDVLVSNLLADAAETVTSLDQMRAIRDLISKRLDENSGHSQGRAETEDCGGAI